MALVDDDGGLFALVAVSIDLIDFYRAVDIGCEMHEEKKTMKYQVNQRAYNLFYHSCVHLVHQVKRRQNHVPIAIHQVAAEECHHLH